MTTYTSPDVVTVESLGSGLIRFPDAPSAPSYGFRTFDVGFELFNPQLNLIFRRVNGDEVYQININLTTKTVTLSPLPPPPNSTIPILRQNGSVYTVEFPFPEQNNRRATYLFTIVFTENDFIMMSSLTLSGSPPPPPPPPPPVNTVCRQTDAPLLQIRDTPQVLAPGSQYDQLARTMGYSSFDLIIRDNPAVIYINNRSGRDIALVRVTPAAPVVLNTAPAGTEASYNSAGDRLILVLRGGGLTAEYTLAVDRSTSPVTFGGIVLVISGCETFGTCPALLTTTVTRTADNVLRPTETDNGLARQVGLSTFNIALQSAPGFAYVGILTRTDGNFLTVFTAQNTDYGLSFTVPASALPFTTVHRQGDEITLVLTGLPGSQPNYFTTYKLRLVNDQLVGGTLQVLGCRALGGLPPIPPIPNLPLALPGTEYPQVNISGFLTADSQNVCQLNITVDTASGLCPKLCCSQLTSKSYEFVLYSPQFASVLRGVGCTVVSKAESLNADANKLITYAILRYVFSALLCKPPFNRFDVNLLQQRYTKEFLQMLAGSQFSGAVNFFVKPPYAKFAKYFKN